MKRASLLTWPVLLLLCVECTAWAAQATLIPGVPDGVTGTVSKATGLDATSLATMIGTLSGLIVLAVTAIAKRLGRTSGITTVTVSAVISALLTGVGGYFSGAFGTGSTAPLQAIVAAIGAFISANGIYLALNKQKDAPTSENTAAPAPAVTVNVGAPAAEGAEVAADPAPSRIPDAP